MSDAYATEAEVTFETPNPGGLAINIDFGKYEYYIFKDMPDDVYEQALEQDHDEMRELFEGEHNE